MKYAMASGTALGAVMCLLALGCDMAGPSRAQAIAWEMVGPVHGKEKDGKIKPGEDVSGMACAPETTGKRICLIVDDETQGAQIMIMDDHKLIAGDYLPLISDMFEGKPVELDAEGAAYADGAFYIIGSHGRPRHEKEGDERKNAARQAASSHVFRIRLGEGAVDLASGAISSAPRIEASEPLSLHYPPGSALKRQQGESLEDNGLTVEGMAIRGRNAVIGFRAPLDASHNALLLEVPLDDLFEGSGPVGRVTSLCLGIDGRGKPRGIRDIVAVGETLFGIAGPVNDPPEDAATADYAVWWLGSSGGLGFRSLADKDARIKPEALVPLGGDASHLSALLLYDGPEGGMPKEIMLDLKASGPTPTCSPQRRQAEY